MPTKPAGVGRVNVRVDVADGVELAERVGDTLLIQGRRGRAERIARVGRNCVAQRVGLDHGRDPQVGVLGVAQDLGDGVDVLALVSGETFGCRRELAVGGGRVAVASGEVVDDDRYDPRAAGARCLIQRGVEMPCQPLGRVGSRDGGDVGEPDRGGLGRDDLHLVVEGRVRLVCIRLGENLGAPVVVHVLDRTFVRVLARRVTCRECGSGAAGVCRQNRDSHEHGGCAQP